MDRHLPFKVLESEPIGLSQTRGRSLNQIHELANQSPRKILPPRVECRAMPDNLLWNVFLSPLQPELSTERHAARRNSRTLAGSASGGSQAASPHLSKLVMIGLAQSGRCRRDRSGNTPRLSFWYSLVFTPDWLHAGKGNALDDARIEQLPAIPLPDQLASLGMAQLPAQVVAGHGALSH
jgi:hypothetical protein